MTARPRRLLHALSVVAMLAVLGACDSDDGDVEGGAAGADDRDAARSDDDDPFGNPDGADGEPRGGSSASGGSGGRESDGGSTDRDASADDASAGSDAASSAGDGGSGGEGSGGVGGGTPGGPMGTQPIGAACANDGNCSQESGEAVCCINSCELVQDCPESPGYLPCTTRSDCQIYGGSKVCCEVGSQRFCTKQSACSGEIIP